MENNLDFATNGVSVPHTYTNTTHQGNSDLDYQPISSRSTPPSSPAAASNDTKDQAARLRALLSSHLSEGGAGSGQATGADRLEALIDMLYAMTAPAEAVTAAAPVVPEEKPAAAPVAEAYTVTLPEPIKETPILEPQNVAAALAPAPLNVESALSPAPSPVEAPAAHVTETASASTAPISVGSIEVEAPVAQWVETASAPSSEQAHNGALPSTPAPVAEITASAPSFVAEAQAVSPLAVPQALEASQIEAPHAELPQTETSPSESPQEQAQLLETIPPTVETTAEPARLGETFLLQESQAPQEPTAFVKDFTEEDFTEDSPAVFATNEAIYEDVHTLPKISSMTGEVLTMEEKSALLNPLKEERTPSAGNITFNFVTDKSTATLNIPMQANLSQITFEQRLDEIIFKIHLSL